jgi:hypothetical protein
VLLLLLLVVLLLVAAIGCLAGGVSGRPTQNWSHHLLATRVLVMEVVTYRSGGMLSLCMGDVRRRKRKRKRRKRGIVIQTTSSPVHILFPW